MRTIQLPFYARLALILFSVVLVYVILVGAAGIFVPLTFALLFSVLLYPLAGFLETRFHFNRSLAAIVPIVGFLILLGCFVYFMAVQLVNFTEDLPMLRQRFGEIFFQLQRWISRELHITTRTQSAYLSKSSGSLVDSVAGSVKNVFYSLSTILLWIVFVIIFTFFMLFHRRLLNRFMLHLFKPGDRPKVSEILRETKLLINSYIQALLVEMVILSFVNSIMFVAMGIRYALLLGVMAACFNIIPYLGMYSSILITFLVTFANSGGNTALIAGLGLFCVHLIDSNMLMPRLVGRKVKMNPFITILAVLIGEFVWGVPGMFLFIPIAGIVKLICERVDSLEAWGILIGVEEKEIAPVKKGKDTA